MTKPRDHATTALIVNFVLLPSNNILAFLIDSVSESNKMTSKKLKPIEPLKRSRSFCSLSDNVPSDVAARRRDNYSGYRLVGTYIHTYLSIIVSLI